MRAIDAEFLKQYKMTFDTAKISGEFIPAFVIDKAPTVKTDHVARWHTLADYKVKKIVECIHCNTMFEYKKNGSIIVDKFNFCPVCGSSMIGGNEK